MKNKIYSDLDAAIADVPDGARAAIVADGEDVFRAFMRERLNQIVGEAGAAEAAEHHARAVGNVGDGSVEVGVDFIFHSSL
jgi:hypothetical protein